MTLTFHPFASWSAIAIDGACVGYMDRHEDQTWVHLKAHAPEWLKSAAAREPFTDHMTAQNAIKSACEVATVPA